MPHNQVLQGLGFSQDADDADDDVQISQAQVREGPSEPTTGTPIDTPDQQRQARQRQAIREQSVPERAFRAAAAFIPTDVPGIDVPGIDAEGVPGARFIQESRRQVRTVAQDTEGAAGTALDLLGPPQTETGAQLEAAFLGVPFPAFGAGRAGARLATRGAGRGAGRAAAREAGEEAVETTITRSARGEAVETAAPRVTAREAGETAATRPARSRAAGQTAEEAAETAAARSTRRTAASEASEEAGSLLARGRRFAQKRPLATAGGAAAAGFGIARLTTPSTDPTATGGGDGSEGAAGVGDDPTLPPHDLAPGAAGTGPFGPTGVPGVLELGALDRLAGGLGAAVDRIGGGIADTLRALGIPIGKGAGKAIAVGGILLATAYGASLVIDSAATASSSSTSSSSSKSSGSLPTGITRGPDGKFKSVT